MAQNLINLLIGVLALAGIAGGAAAYFLQSKGKGSIKLLETNIRAYKDAEKLKDQRIAYLEGQLVTKDETIKRLLNDPPK